MNALSFSIWTHLGAYFLGVISFPVIGYGVLKLMEAHDRKILAKYELAPEEDM